mgnify:CR=1 FL=1
MKMYTSQLFVLTRFQHFCWMHSVVLIYTRLSYFISFCEKGATICLYAFASSSNLAMGTVRLQGKETELNRLYKTKIKPTRL